MKTPAIPAAERTRRMMLRLCHALALWLSFTTASLHAQVPHLVNYQGRVAVGSVNFTGTGQFKFALVDSTGATSYWSNDGTSSAGSQPTSAVTLTVTKGLYSVLLGDTSLTNMTAIPASVWTNADVRLRVWFNDGTNGSQLLTPDQRLAPSGYLPDASVTSAKIADLVVSAPQLAGSAVTAAKIATGAVNSSKLASNLTLGGTTTGTFSGSGAALTNLSGGNLTTGSVTSTQLADGTIVNADISTSAAIADTKLATISSTGKVANSATTAESTSTPSTLVLRDASGNFSAGTITAALNGNASSAGSATNFTGSLSGDVTGGQGTTAIAATTVTGKLLTGFSSTTGIVSATDSILAAISKLDGNLALKAPLASPTFTGTVTVPTNGLVVGTNQLVASGGYVGVGVTTPGVRLDVAGGPLTTLAAGAWFSSASGGQPLSNWTNGIQGNLSIRASNGINATGFIATSDGRIKVIKGRSDAAEDLLTLQRIEVTDYHFRDKVSQGDAPHKKVIAQQVEKVYPQAVSRMTDVVPDIYQKAICKDGWIEMENGLHIGERVRLIGDKITDVFEVLEAEASRFRTAYVDDGRVFVYGREVKDFRMVDYEAIGMLNVSVTQELARRLDAKEKEMSLLAAENTAVKRQLAVIMKQQAEEIAIREAALKAVEARLARLEQSAALGSTVAAKLTRKE